MPTNDGKHISILICPRCDAVNHRNLEYKPFTSSVYDRDPETLLRIGCWPFYAICPTTNEPILIRFMDAPDYVSGAEVK